MTLSDIDQWPKQILAQFRATTGNSCNKIKITYYRKVNEP